MALTRVMQALQEASLHAGPPPVTHGDYDSSLKNCTIQPTTSEEVSRFIQVIKPFVVGGDLTFALRNGGIFAPPDDQEIKGDTVILDLSQMNDLNIRSDGIAEIGAGGRWDNVLESLGRSNLSTTSGRNGGKGIGDLALQAGLSFFSSRRGFVSDNVANYEVVLASGHIVQANAKNNTDLWASLKGGSNNFGIVTRYDMETFPQGPLWGGYVYYYPSSFPGQIDSMVREIQKPHASHNTHIILSTAYAAQVGQTICVNRVYDTAGLEASSDLGPFTTVTPQIEGLGSLDFISVKDASVTETGSRRAHMDTTVKADTATLQAATNIFISLLDPIKAINDSKLVASLVFEPLPLSLIETSITKSGDIFGLGESHGPLVSISLVAMWTDKANDDIIIKHLRDVLQKIKDEAVARGQAAQFEIMSTAFHFEDPIGSYGVQNKQKMQAVSRRYDPDGLFQNGLVGSFPLFP